MKHLVRTQISLPQDLKEKITREARQRNISMAEYLRQAAAAYERKTKLTQTMRRKIANELKGSINPKTGWGSVEQVKEWLRRERNLSDARLTGL
ncbi:MAG: CopG family transcriptional regulator [Patescibacteria group bacterium]